MNDEEIYNYIKNTLINKKGKLNSSAIRFNKFKFIENFINDKIKIGNTFLEKLYLYYYNISAISFCKECGLPTKFVSFNKGYNQYCSASCSGKQSIKKIKEKYNVENVFQLNDIKQKIKQTNLKKYGLENPWSFGSDNYKQIIKEKYNVENVFQLNSIKQKIKQTNLKKYGVEHNSYNKQTIKKRKLKRITSFYKNISQRVDNKIIPLFNINEYYNVTKKYKWKCNACNTEFYDHLDDGHIPKCPICYPKLNGYSLGEKELSDWIKLLNITIIENDREIIKPYEVDIYLPDYKLAIEYNGLYWHSIKFVDDKYYHQNKVKLANEKGIRLLHIWEHEWLEEKELIKEIIQYYINNLSISIEIEEPKLYNIHDNLIWI